MCDLPRISDSEWLVMRVLWSRGAATANEVVDELASETRWKPRTVKTLITRLMRKGAVKFSREGRMYRYYPAVTEAECVRMERRSFAKRVYGGTMTPMLANMPRSAMGAISAVEKERSPLAVVTWVMTTARPEWPMAWAMASALLPCCWKCRKKMARM